MKYARDALEVEPALELAHRIAIQCLIECGQVDSAIHQYRLCEAELAYLEGRRPSEQTRHLYEQLMEGSNQRKNSNIRQNLSQT
jgi:hypothetical protein